MTTTDTYTKTPQAPGRFRLPDPPEKHPDDMTTFDHLTITGGPHYLAGSRRRSQPRWQRLVLQPASLSARG